MLPADLPAKRIMRLFIVLLLVGLHLCACQEDKRVKGVDAFFTMEDFGPAIRLKGEILPMDSIWKPARIRVEDSLLILTDMTCDISSRCMTSEQAKNRLKTCRGEADRENLCIAGLRSMTKTRSGLLTCRWHGSMNTPETLS